MNETIEPGRKANAVLLYTAVPPDSVVLAVASDLRQRGFQIVELDPQAGHLLTAPGIEVGAKGWPLAIRVARISGGVIFTGCYYLAELPGRPAFPAQFLGFEWSPAKNSFRQLEKTARLFGRGQVGFRRQ